MRKFRAVLKEKQSVSNRLHEKKVLGSFKKVYNALLNKYSIPNLTSLNEKHQIVFLAELNSYWDEKAGVLPKGRKFLKGNSDMLTEQSTSVQKANYMKKRAVPAISETLRQSGLKWKLYDIIDEMYKGIGARRLAQVLTAKDMTDVLVESFRDSVKTFMTEVNYELSENSKPSRKNLSKKKHKVSEGFFGFGGKKNKIKVQGEAAIASAQFVIDLLKGEGIDNFYVDEKGAVADETYKVIAHITRLGYIDIGAHGTWPPEEMVENSNKILDALLFEIKHDFNYPKNY